MALCLADSLVARRGFDLRDQLDRYLRWLRDGYLSSAEADVDSLVDALSRMDAGSASELLDYIENMVALEALA